ncbi:MAG: hypothetical protein ACYTBJ_21260 [Planctomycetota bacterium]
MDLGKHRPFFLLIYAGFMVLFFLLLFLVLFTDVFRTSKDGDVPQLVWLAGAFLVWLTILITLLQVTKAVDILQENVTRLERIIEAVRKQESVLAQVAEDARLSESTRRILFGDADIELLRQAVLDKLEQKDFQAAGKMVDLIAEAAGYKELAGQLRRDMDRRRGELEGEKMSEAVAEIEELLASYQWAEASGRIEKLIREYPKSGEAKSLRQRLVDKKEERKRVLLAAWDDAVQRKATDRSLEILKELDMYLTPNEALALQEAAKDVFKMKLHNLGVQFSLAVSGKNWAKAVEVGEQITRDFPNSKVAGEIRENMGTLKQKVQQQPG